MKTWMMIKSSIRKNRSSSITLVLLILLTSVLLYSSLMISFHVDGVVDEVNKENAGADFAVGLPRAKTELLERLLEQTKGYVAKETEDAVSSYGKIQNRRVEKKAQTMGLLFLNLDQKRSISTVNLLDVDSAWPEHAIVVPYSLKQSFGYRTGDEIEIEFGGVKKKYQIYGFLQDVMFSTALNVNRYILYVKDAEFKALESQVPEAMRTTYIKVKLENGSSSNEYQDEVIKKVSLEKGIANEELMTSNYEQMKVGTTTMISIVMMILIVFSLLMLVIALIVIRFTIVNHVEEDIKNIGAMEAAGFTSWMMRKVLILQFILLAAIGSVLGLVAAFCGSDFVTKFVSSSIGLRWKASFSMISLVTTLAMIFVFVIGIAVKTSSRLKKITPIVALRNGLSTYSFKKNYLPLDRTRGNLQLLLGLKQMLYARRQNLSMGLIGFLMAFTFMIGFTMLENFTGPDTVLIELAGTEKADICIGFKSKEQRDQVEKALATYDEIRKTLHFQYANLVIAANGKDISTNANVCNDFGKLEVRTVFEGRYPKSDNEMVVSNLVAKRLSIQVGDVVTVKGKDGNREYIVVGLNQHINHLGNTCTLTEEGMRRSNGEYFNDTVNIYVKDGVNEAAFMSKLEKDLADNTLSFVNMKITYENSLKEIQEPVKYMCILLNLVVVLVVTLILFYMIKAKLAQDKTILGIQKAMGFTTRQLIVHQVISFCMVMLVSFVLAAVAFSLFSTSIFTLMFQGTEFKKCSLEISALTIVGTGIGLTIFVVVVTSLASLRIRKISPRQLFMD